MEETFNLDDILDGHEKEIFYIPMYGEVEYIGTDLNCDNQVVHLFNKNIEFGPTYYYEIYSNGKFNNDGVIAVYPSEELYKKYPFNAEAAWKEWSTPWRAELEGTYYYIDEYLTVQSCTDSQFIVNDEMYNCHNYFRTEKAAKAAAEQAKVLFKVFQRQ